MFKSTILLWALAMATFAQSPNNLSLPSTAGDDFKLFIETIVSTQPELEDFQCEFEGNTVIKSESIRQRLRLPEDGVSQRFSGVFIWTALGDISVNTLHRIEPGSAIEREQIIVRASKDESEHYLRHDNAPIGRGTIDRPSKVNANRAGSLGSILLIDTIKRYRSWQHMVFSVASDSLDGKKVDVLSIFFDNSSLPYQKFWIDFRRGGHVVRWEGFSPGGELTGRSNIELRSFPLGQKSVWMPVSAVAESHNGFKDGKPYYPAEPTRIESIYIVKGTLEFNKRPAPATFKITYKSGTPISDNLRKLEYEFGQQKVGAPMRDDEN